MTSIKNRTAVRLTSLAYEPTKPVVTIGLVVKNCEDTIGETVKSVTAQDYPHKLLEIIVVDGGSKDKTMDVIARATRASNIPIRIYSDEGGGLGKARQIAVERAHGDYVLWVDSDATIPDNYVSYLVGYMVDHPRHGGVKGIQDARSQPDLVTTLERLTMVLRTGPRHVFDTNGQIFRLEAVRQAGGFDVREGAGEDVDLVLRMMTHGWSFSVIQLKFYHRVGSLKEVFQKRKRDGYGYHYRLHKHTVLRPLLYQVFPISVLVGLKDARSAYKLTRQKSAFLLPCWYCLKGIPWCIGFGKSHIEGYGHA
jgi:glycosyltransferase involved in cell wall biosynthesis